MFIVMHCMGMPFNGATIETESLGGSETAAYYLAKGLVKQGHSVTLFTTHPEEGEWDGVRYIYTGEASEGSPLGANFHFYAMSTPHDVSIIQRAPTAYYYRWASKVNLWWTHDLALYRQREAVQASLWNIDGILTVSEYHKEQLCEVYDVDPDFVFPITNGVDLELFESAGPLDLLHTKKHLVYSSRPERGLENLVEDGGIMDQLGDDYQLHVCSYDNTMPEIADYYRYLYSQCKAKSNIVNEGSLTKSELAGLMKSSDLLVYPTTFEEVSCITAMEAMAAGLPMISSNHAALPETCGKGALLLELEDGEVNRKAFIKRIKKLMSSRSEYKSMQKLQKTKATNYSWDRATERLEKVILGMFDNQSPAGQFNQLIHVSDYYAASAVLEAEFVTAENVVALPTPLDQFQHDVVDECYEFAADDTFAEHYEAYYEYEKDRGIDYGPEPMDGNPRFECVADRVSKLDAGSTVLDYGCAHGHFTINLALRFPELEFIGVDITESNIQKAEAWAEDKEIDNVFFYCADINNIQDYDKNFFEQELFKPAPALVIAAEVLEHVASPKVIVDALRNFMEPEGQIVITTPYGPWEAEGYAQHYPWRAHVHHFERQDLHDLWSHMPEFNILVVPSGAGKQGEAMGSYITTFTAGEGIKQGDVNYARKLEQTIAMPTVSLCMIVKDCENTIGQCIESAIDLVDEVIINIDKNTTDNTEEVIKRLAQKHVTIRLDVDQAVSPLEVGFDAARNATLDRANGDWILWLDADEVLTNAVAARKYLRNNQFKGFAVKQHHFSVHPLGVLKTDYPCRLFRNNRDVQFVGRVHEHPELVVNEGVGKGWLIPDVDITHYGYDTEVARRKRFVRNFELMEWDRKDHPERTLGKLLWIRDLAQSIQFELEAGAPLNGSMYQRAEEGIALWPDLVKESSRMAKETLPFYSSLVKLLGERDSVDYEFTVNAQPAGRMNGSGGETHKGTFFNKDHAREFFNMVESEKLDHLNSRYL